MLAKNMSTNLLSKHPSKLLLHYDISWTSKGNNIWFLLEAPLGARLRICTKTRFIYLRTFWAKDCKHSIQNMLALITDAAVLHMNSEMESRGNARNWLPIHSWSLWLGSRTKTPQSEKARTGERWGRGGAPADTCGPIKTSSNDGEGWLGPYTPLCTQAPERMHLHAHRALWRQHYTIVKCTQKAHMHKSTIYLSNLIIVTND